MKVEEVNQVGAGSSKEPAIVAKPEQVKASKTKVKPKKPVTKAAGKTVVSATKSVGEN